MQHSNLTQGDIGELVCTTVTLGDQLRLVVDPRISRFSYILPLISRISAIHRRVKVNNQVTLARFSDSRHHCAN